MYLGCKAWRFLIIVQSRMSAFGATGGIIPSVAGPDPQKKAEENELDIGIAAVLYARSPMN
jgi:hypothetical protein